MSVTSPALNNGLCTDLQSCAIGAPKHSDIELETVPSLRPFHLSQFCSCDLLGLKLSHMPSRHPSAHSSTSSRVHIEGYPARVHDFLRTQIQRRAFNRVDRANCCACFTLRCRRRYRACNCAPASLDLPLFPPMPDLPFASFPFPEEFVCPWFCCCCDLSLQSFD